MFNVVRPRDVPVKTFSRAPYVKCDVQNADAKCIIMSKINKEIANKIGWGVIAEGI